MADEKVETVPAEYHTPSPTPEVLERSLLGRAHPDYKKKVVKEEKKEAPPPPLPPPTEEKHIEAEKPAGTYRTRAQRASE